MGGKSSTSTQQVSIPPEVLARYNSVNATAEQAAAQPFQAYNGQFVAPLSSTQEAGIANTNTAAGQAQPYFQTATDTLMGAQQATSPYYQAATQALMSGLGQGGYGTQAAYGSLYGANAAAAPLQAAGAYNMGAAYAGAQPFNQQAAQGLGAAQQAGAGYTAQGYNSAQPYNALATGLGLAGAAPVNAQQIGGQQIGQFMSPYIGSVLQGTEGILNQQNQQALSGQLGNAIQSGAFGGDRAGVAAANLAQQQQLANAQTYSGILNQGYGQALAAAQQQQGVNLSAEQANRAALQQASGQMLGIGQQGYAQGLGAGQQLFGQGLSAAQQQAALGQQLYGQGMGLASAQTGLGQQLFGQGATTSQQQAALAQQQYAQGLGGASGLSSLGQNIYGTGAQTAQQLAALGTGAQGASLAGAQAQLAAGQTEQQTQQAQDTALYNQFLQQQSYPFQTAQFLANIAEGTGSLSGSTTTTTQPGGFFSDERLKENIKPIGKTNDGQTIYSYNYKGDHRTQIGLLAQEVEKKHPEAVGLAGGYKTVDYAKATHDAERHRRASGGGLVAPEHAYQGFADGGMPGFDPMMAQNMAATETGMFGPYGTSGGLGGGHSRVPGATLPVGHLQTAGGLAPQKSGLEQGAQMANLLGSAEKDYDWGKKTFGGKDKPSQNVLGYGGDESEETGKDQQAILDKAGFKKGGLAGHYAEGGMPYGEEGPGLDIPDEQKAAPQLATAQGSPGKGRSGMDDITDMAKIAEMFANRGGRIGKADGGDTSDDPWDANWGDDGTPFGDSVANSTATNTPDISAILDKINPFAQHQQRAQHPAAPAPAPTNTDGGLAGAIAKVEGTGKNPTSSAKGMYQLTNPTFIDMYRRNFGDQAKAMSDKQIIALRNSPQGEQLSEALGPKLIQHNIDVLRQNGVDTTAGNVYLAHFLGPQTAIKVLNAHPDQDVADIVSNDAVHANRNILQGKSVRDVINWAQQKMAHAGADPRTTFAKGGLAGSRKGYSGIDGDSYVNPDTVNLDTNAPSALPSAQDIIDRQLNPKTAFTTSADLSTAAMPGRGGGGGGSLPNPLDLLPKGPAPQPYDRTGRPTNATLQLQAAKNHADVSGAAADHNNAPVVADQSSKVNKRVAAANGNAAAANFDFGGNGSQSGVAAATNSIQPVNDTVASNMRPDTTGLIGMPTVTPQGGLAGAMNSLSNFGGNLLNGAETGLKNYGSDLYEGKSSAWIPLLSGLAAMGTAPTRNLGVALASGVGSGAQAAQKQREYEIAQQKTALQGQQVAQTGAQARFKMAQQFRENLIGQIVAGGTPNPQDLKSYYAVMQDVYNDPSINPNAGKSGATNPYASPPDLSAFMAKPEKDSFHAQLAVDPDDLDRAGNLASALGAHDEAARQHQRADQIRQQWGAAGQAQGKTGTIPVPGYIQVASAQGAAAQQVAGDYSDVQNYRNEGVKAENSLASIRELKEAAKNLSKPGAYGTGKMTPQLMDYYSKINQAATALGMPAQFDATKIASAEEIQKVNFRIGQALAASGGGHPAGFIVNSAAGATPGLTNSPKGLVLLANSLEQQANMARDRGEFFADYYTKNHTLNGSDAQRQFETTHSPQSYVDRARFDTIDPNHLGVLKKYQDPNTKDPHGKTLREALDQAYGVGTTDMLLRHKDWW